ncbi:MBL fold metallo-hydrolase [Brevundimonas sp. LM2]|uniref:MBL fold metallo-hydrolase n=1 Tax=Brevundimonas sp. LM2 TaxID=1938605 RepID=UPI000983B3C4|nr:MBL fold metallo-hydrolase [Brevundimonas sp. LM2]AQR63352.1 MBL fold metallo-hydrolase [Brevundimonas sp. LM2]
MIPHFKIAAASLLLSGFIATAACSQPVQSTGSATTVAPAASADVYRFKVGTIETIALRDGGLSGLPNDNKILGVGRTPAEVSAVLTANGLAGETFDLSVQPLLVRDGSRLVLIDTGAGGAMGPGAGKLVASLGSAGIEPSAITDILISHAHGDHVGGLVDASGALIYPNAVIRMSAPEWTALQADTEMAALVTAITPKVETFAPGAQVTPAILAVPIQGHTPGHSGFEVHSGEDRLLYIADSAHHHVVSVQKPDWANSFDGNAQAMQSRIALLGRAADENLRLYAVHFPYPGIGRVTRRDDGTLVWTPEAVPAP